VVVAAYEFFNPLSYQNSGTLDWELQHAGSALNSRNGLIKSFQVTRSEIHLKNNLIYNYPFQDGTVLQTFSICSFDVSLAPVNSSNAQPNQFDVLSYRLVQSSSQTTDFYMR